ncbi:helix-turn-helix domain-containing protein [Aliiruegeria lutimaris]|uniref:DNA binding domain-containing protein, excisionase family n=1 Tax=Aliiruegeria lutimaris TaxID=571298 RepID=A0A1G9QCV6_9RHOB|nr:helix-turn-helix domain-containing protein [Aliiruegeria lutimaris]SDM08773.1 DNA binding domain-containing protein, excisionase family [Aliiruegeria lutimaris]
MADLPVSPNAKYLTVKEVAALFRICPKTVRRWIAGGELPATRLGRDWRIARTDLKALAAARGNRGLADVL